MEKGKNVLTGTVRRSAVTVISQMNYSKDLSNISKASKQTLGCLQAPVHGVSTSRGSQCLQVPVDGV